MMTHNPGDIRLMSIHGNVGRFIRFGQFIIGDGNSPYEHAAIYLGNNMFLDAEPGGAIVSHYNYLDNDHTYWSTGILHPTPKQSAGIIRSAYGYIGTPYSFFDYGAIALHAMHLPIPFLHQYINNVHHMICSQLVVQCYLDNGYHIFTDNRWDGFVTPGNLFQRFKFLKSTQY